MSSMTVAEAEVILRETSELIREKLQPLADAGFNDFDINVKTNYVFAVKSPMIIVEVTTKLNNIDWR